MRFSWAPPSRLLSPQFYMISTLIGFKHCIARISKLYLALGWVDIVVLSCKPDMYNYPTLELSGLTMIDLAKTGWRKST